MTTERDVDEVLLGRELELERRLVRLEEGQILEGRERALEAKALAIQATEYARRLDELNHAHARALEVQQTYLPRELFTAHVVRNEAYQNELAKWRDGVNAALANVGRIDAYATDLAKWRDGVNAALANQAGKSQGIAGAWGVALGAVGLVGGVIGIVLALR